MDHLGHQHAAAGDIPGAPPATLAHQRMGDVAVAFNRGALHLADPAILDKPEHALIARRITQLIADRQLPRMARLGGGDAGRALQRLGQRFFAKHVFSGIERRDHGLFMQGRRRRHRHQRHLRVGDQFGGRGIAAGDLERVRKIIEPLGGDIRRGHQNRVLRNHGDRRGMLARDDTRTDNANLDHSLLRRTTAAAPCSRDTENWASSAAARPRNPGPWRCRARTIDAPGPARRA